MYLAVKMITDHTPETLKAFERQIANDFNAGLIRAPVHLAGGCEQILINIFASIHEEDWVFTQWRSHLHCLLKGVPPDQLRSDILAGRSITLCYPEYRILSSAIVGGILPIATGVALAMKRKYVSHKVWAFVGDMTAQTGIFHECLKYAMGHDLLIHFIIEDNNRSVCTETGEVWGKENTMGLQMKFEYVLPWPHSGAGKHVEF